MVEAFKTIDDLLKHYKVKSYKDLPNGQIAIRKSGEWIYFSYKLKRGYIVAGASLKLIK